MSFEWSVSEITASAERLRLLGFGTFFAGLFGIMSFFSAQLRHAETERRVIAFVVVPVHALVALLPK